MHHLWDLLSIYLVHTHGGKKALGLALLHSFRAGLGGFGPYRQIDWQQVTRVVFVCKGNICRSAFAVRRFRVLGVEAASAGLDADSGKPADPLAIQVAWRFGTDLAEHRSAHIDEVGLAGGDLLVAFEPDHADRLRRFASRHAGVQVTLLGLWSPLPGMVYVHDPYGLPEAYFEHCFARIDRGLAGLSFRFSTARSAMDTTT